MRKNNLLFTSVLAAILLVGCQQSADKSGEKNDTTVQTTIQPVKQASIANNADQILDKQEVPVLCYHRIEDGKKGDYTVSPATFSAHMQVLADSGYTSILPAQLYDYLLYNKDLPEKPVMITFDDSRTEHFNIAAPVMEKLGFRGVFFIMTITYNKKNYMTTEEIAELSANRHEIGLHSWDHTMATKYMTEEDWKKNVADPKLKLEGFTAKPVEYWAYPNGVFNHEAAEGLSKHFKISFILTSKRDTILPLQTVRRMIVPEMTPQGLIKSMHRTFAKK